jgi:hypothetical protein
MTDGDELFRDVMTRWNMMAEMNENANAMVYVVHTAACRTNRKHVQIQLQVPLPLIRSYFEQLHLLVNPQHTLHLKV